MPSRQRGQLVPVALVVQDAQLYGLAKLGVEVLVALLPLLQQLLLYRLLLLPQLLLVHQRDVLLLLFQLQLLLQLILSDFLVVGDFPDHVQNLLGEPLVDDFEGFAVLKGLAGHVDV